MTVIRKDSSCVTTWQTSEYVSTCDQIYTRLNISTAHIALKDREDVRYVERLADWEAENARAQRGRERGRGRGRGGGGGTILAKLKKATIPKRVPPPLLRDFLARNNDELSQEEGSNTGSSDDGSGKDGEGAEDDNDDEQDE